jgi:hypothetical protein
MQHTRTLAAALLFMLLIAAPAWAGPPLICHAHDIGSARSLPWLTTASWNGADSAYDVSHLTDDTLALLTPSAPVAVRMETMRRAAIYASRRSGLSDELTIRLLGRALDAQAEQRADPSAWFDAGYFVETVRDGARIYPALHAPNLDGLSWMRIAGRTGGSDMQPAIAMVERARSGRL